MSRKLYVGNLPHSATEETLSSIFVPHGQVKSIDFITHLCLGESMRFACIGMASGLEAQTAIRKLNGTAYGGKPMKVERWPTTEGNRFLFGKAA